MGNDSWWPSDAKSNTAERDRDMKSIFRPPQGPKTRMLDNHRPLIKAMGRRGLIKDSLSLGALTMLAGCNFDTPESVEAGLRQISKFNDWIQAAIFNPNKLAPTYPASMVLKPPQFNAYYDITKVKPIDGETWRLELSGLINDKAPWSLERLQQLPEQEEIIRHICVEGWDYIGQWAGPRLSTFLEHIGADTRARYVNFLTADDYPSSIDMATALHPQTLLATKYAGAVLDAPFGFPVRLRTATKLGFKNPKWITAIEVTNTYKPGYWEKLGFNWFSGI